MAAGVTPRSMATSVRVRDNKRLVTDGPFAETREQLGGYFLIEAHNLDEAIAVAAKPRSYAPGLFCADNRRYLNVGGSNWICGISILTLDGSTTMGLSSQ